MNKTQGQQITIKKRKIKTTNINNTHKKTTTKNKKTHKGENHQHTKKNKQTNTE